MRTIDEIIIHCAATPEGKNFTAKDIERWHKARGFKTIGYHYVITLDGKQHQGRPLEQMGAHCKGRNASTIGICYIGGVDAKGKPKDTRTEAQTRSLLGLCQKLLDRYPSIRKISGHNQYANKACPSFDVAQDPLGKLIS